LVLSAVGSAFEPAAAQQKSPSPSVGAPAPREAKARDARPLAATGVRDTALAALIRAETGFMNDVERRHLAGWIDGFGDSIATFPRSGPIEIGKAAIKSRMAKVFADTSVHVRWHPTYARLSASGELGYTYGYYRWDSQTADGKPDTPEDGKYVTIWQRDAKERWRVIVDIGTAGPVPPTFFNRKAGDHSP
jgi:ketosteroid isomerase-like protein